MRLIYLGPLVIGIDHPALVGLDCDSYSPSCFAVEVGPEAGVSGAVIEGDVLVVDESHSLGHDDLAVVEMDDALHLYRVFRVGSRYRLLPPSGGSGLMATAKMVRGVVVHQPALFTRALIERSEGTGCWHCLSGFASSARVAVE